MYWRGVVKYSVDAIAAVFQCDVIVGEDVPRDPVVQLRASHVKEYLNRGDQNAVVAICDFALRPGSQVRPHASLEPRKLQEVTPQCLFYLLQFFFLHSRYSGAGHIHGGLRCSVFHGLFL